MSARLVRELRARGIDPTALGLADAFWLASYVLSDPPPAPPPAAESPRPAPDRPPPRPGPAEPDEEERDPGPEPADSAAALYPVGEEPAGAAPATVQRLPSVRALAGQRALARAFQLLRRGTGQANGVALDDLLDETETVERSVASRELVPVLRPHATRWLDLVLVVDTAPSMAWWRPTADAVTGMLIRSGAFRTARTVRVDTDRPSAVPLATAVGARARATVVLVLTDGVGRAWHDGRALAELEFLARTATVAVVPALPQRLWAGTGLATERLRVLAAEAGAPNSRWTVRGRRGPRTPIPVLALEPRFVRPWARLVAGPSAWTGIAALRAPDPVAAPEPVEPAEVVRRFRERATPTAFRLACHLSAAAPLTLPVMRLVQRAFVPGSAPAHLAEVLLGGLCRRRGAEGRPPAYDFAPGVREELQSFLTRGEALALLELVGTHLTGHGGGPFSLAALVGRGDGAAGEDLRPLALVAASLLHRMGGPARDLARRATAGHPILLRHGANGRVWAEWVGHVLSAAGIPVHDPWAGEAETAGELVILTADGPKLAEAKIQPGYWYVCVGEVLASADAASGGWWTGISW